MTSGRLEALEPDLRRIRGQGPPDVSVVVPVSARDDLERVLDLLEDVCRYRGRRTVEVVLAVNRYEPEAVPGAVDDLRRAGVVVTAEPDAFRAGEVVCFSARMLAVEAGSSDRQVTFDADCRVPDATALLDWYGDQLDDGAVAAYTPVAYDDLRPMVSVRARVAFHHAARWMKRRLVGIPTLRGGNFAIDRPTLVELRDAGLVGDELSIGPALRARGARVAYSRRRPHVVRTSGRWMLGGWRRLGRYLVYRLQYNAAALRTDDAAVARRRETLHQENLR